MFGEWPGVDAPGPRACMYRVVPAARALGLADKDFAALFNALATMSGLQEADA